MLSVSVGFIPFKFALKYSWLMVIIVSDVQVYTASIFYLLMGVGIYLVRKRHARLGVPRPPFRAWHVCIVLNILAMLYVLILSWYPPAEGANGGDVSFWYASYIVTGYGIIALCAIYYFLWTWAIPHWQGYRLRQELIDLGNGAQSHRLKKVKVEDLPEWDSTHDAAGGILSSGVASDNDFSIEKTGATNIRAV
jgi:hypothetical protein